MTARRRRRLGRRPEHELGRVEQLDGQPAADLHLAGVEGGVGAEPAAGRPVAHRVGAVLLQQVHRGDDVALGLGHLLAVRVEDPAGDRGVAPGQRAVLQVRRGRTVENSQVRMISCACGRRSIGKTRCEQVVVALPAAGDLRGQRRGGPGVHDVRVADEAAGLAALVLGVAGRRVGGRVDRQRVLGRHDRRVVVAARPSSSSGYQTGIGTPKNRCRVISQSPVRPSHPVLVADPHVRRVPGQLAAPRQQPLAQRRVAPAVADVPLPGGDDLQRLVAASRRTSPGA